MSIGRFIHPVSYPKEPAINKVDLHALLSQPLPPPSWLIEDLYPRDGVFILAGLAGVGKSFLSYNLAFCIATGTPFLGIFPCKPAKVLYFDEENAYPDFSAYCHWIWHGLGQPDLDLVNKNLHIEHMSLAATGRKYMLEVAAQVHPAAIILDTVTPVLAIQDENDNSEATSALKFVRGLQKVSDNHTTAILLKHQRDTNPSHKASEGSSEPPRAIRGAKAWVGSTDGCYFHIRGSGRPRADGLKVTYLSPDKSRAFGLRHTVAIEPELVPGPSKAVKLQGKIMIPESPKPSKK